MISLLTGGALGALYFYSLRLTSLAGSRGSMSMHLRSALKGFILRLTSIGLIMYGLGRFTSIDLPWLVLALTVVFSLFLFQEAAKGAWNNTKHRGAQPARGN